MRAAIRERVPGGVLRPGMRTFHAIRDKAVELIWKHGFEGANLRMLARSVGIKPASLYNHIASKQELLFDLIRGTTEEIAEITSRELDGISDPLEQMRRFVRLFLDYSIANRKAGSVFITEMRRLNPRNYRVIATMQQQYHDFVREIVERGIAAGQFRVTDPDMATFAIVQMIMGITQWYDPRGRLNPEDLKDAYTELTLQMVGAKLK